jgi:hypothetical protein
MVRPSNELVPKQRPVFEAGFMNLKQRSAVPASAAKEARLDDEAAAP